MVFISLILLVVGFVILVRGADYFVAGTSAFASRMRISELMVGLTVVAMGTSLPELAICITSALNGTGAIAVGNVIGSNVGNILFVLGFLAILSPLMVYKRSIFYEAPFILVIIGVLYYIISRYGVLTRAWACVLLGLFMLYLLYLFIMSRNNPKQETKYSKQTMSIPRMIWYVMLGLVAVILGSDVIVQSATDIARHIGVSDRIIGLTVIALGTSLPELVTGIVAVYKKQPDIAVGNIIGSSIFNMLFVLGMGAIVAPIYFERAFIFDLCMSSVAVLMLILCSYRNMYIGRIAGVVFLGIYGIYLLQLI